MLPFKYKTRENKDIYIYTYFLIIVKETLREKTDNNELVVYGGGRKPDGRDVKGVSLF